MDPTFYKNPNGHLDLETSIVGRQVEAEIRRRGRTRSLPPKTVRDSARRAVLRKGGDPNNEIHVLGEHEMQFGKYQGQTFRWVLSNSLGYAGWLVSGLEADLSSNAYHIVNKRLFKQYTEHFPEGREAIRLKGRPQMDKPKTDAGKQSATVTSPFSSLLRTSKPLSQESLRKKVQQLKSPAKFQPNLAAISPRKGSISESSDQEFLDEVLEVESELLSGRKRSETSAPPTATVSIPPVATDARSTEPTTSVSVSATLAPPPRQPTPTPSRSEISMPAIESSASIQPPVPDEAIAVSGILQPDEGAATQPEDTTICLPVGWKKTLPKADQQWVSKALFKFTQSGAPELDMTKVDRIWWYPPQPSLIANNKPRVDRYFAQPLLLWMPRKLWKIQLYCPHKECSREEMTSAGLHKKVRHVVDVSGYYSLAAECLVCRRCQRRVISWSPSILEQLDIGHRIQFPCILTAKLACDMKVIRLLRQRGLGNSSSQVYRKLSEQHSESYLQRAAHYLTDCEGFSCAVSSGLLLPVAFDDMPQLMPVPSFRWLMQVYLQDVLSRLDEIKAGITTLFGRVLKIDSTKKVVKKLAGFSAKTAMWATNVANEYGQVIMTVLTASEGRGLSPMIDGIVKRYKDAGEPQPDLLYVDRDCCGPSSIKKYFPEWTSMDVKLDIWHFMRRISTGCTTDSHHLYGLFMGRLSHCIFKWDQSDLQLLMRAKRSELESMGITNQSDADVMRRISRDELATYCRRTTRGAAETITLISQLIEAFDGEKGRDTQGVPLINSDRMHEIWKYQQKHVPCIQDPANIPLYIKTGERKKGGVVLPVFRCARGSTSLECFHLHLNRFIPGSLATAAYFQAYLVDGLSRWNEDRSHDATTAQSVEPHSYSGLLRHTVNRLGEKVLGKKLNPSYSPPRKYTGELIGVEYLYSQTGQVLPEYDINKETETEQSESAAEAEPDQEEEDEGFEEASQYMDYTVPDAASELPEPLPSPTPQSPISTGRPILPIPSEADYVEAHVSTQLPTSDQTTEVVEIVNRRLRQQGQQMQSETSAVTSPEVVQPSGTASQPTQPVPETPPAETSTAETPDPPIDQDDSVGPDNIPGYGRVQDLASFLAGLQDCSSLTMDQASEVIRLWEALSDYDKRHTVYTPRYRSRMTGRFKASKKLVAPGVETTKRLMLGPNEGAAGWPHCNRYVEATISRLCETYAGSKRSEGGIVLSRWALVTRAYNRIRQVIVDNSKVMEETSLQLPLINQTTLTQWYNMRGKSRERKILSQGIAAPEANLTSSERLPSPLPKPDKLPSGRVEDPHQFPSPPNTAGTAKLKLRRAPRKKTTTTERSVPSHTPVPTVQDQPIHTTAPLVPSPIIPTMFLDPMTGGIVFTVPPVAQPSTPPGPVAQQPTTTVPYSTMNYRKRMLQREQEGKVRRKYVKKTDIIQCSKCHKERKPPSHQQYFGNWYCHETATVPFETWREELMSRGYGKKKKSQPATPPPPDDQPATPPPPPDDQ